MAVFVQDLDDSKKIGPARGRVSSSCTSVIVILISGWSAAAPSNGPGRRNQEHMSVAYGGPAHMRMFLVTAARPVEAVTVMRAVPRRIQINLRRLKQKTVKLAWQAEQIVCTCKTRNTGGTGAEAATRDVSIIFQQCGIWAFEDLQQDISTGALTRAGNSVSLVLARRRKTLALAAGLNNHDECRLGLTAVSNCLSITLQQNLNPSPSHL